jgi:hypothetical protein
MVWHRFQILNGWLIIQTPVAEVALAALLDACYLSTQTCAVPAGSRSARTMTTKYCRLTKTCVWQECSLNARGAPR